ncbi:interleukin-6 receptor subunit alpha isoform X2 [Betta splendens]|nr:interleukin-6 receptor subunit alpha isoform X2 [Betta splendens]
MVNGLTVAVAGNSSAPPAAAGSSDTKQPVGRAAHRPQPRAGVTAVTGGNRRPRFSDAGATGAPEAEPARTHAERSSEGDYDEEDDEEEGGNRVTRGINPGPRWKWDGKVVVTGARGGRVESRGALLSLASATPGDSGSYTCHHRGKERFSLKLVVADPPETPMLLCYKKSASGKLRCESEAQNPTAKAFSSYLVVNKSPSDTFQRFPCSYSSRLSRYWCALEHNNKELRTHHAVYLCVTGIAGNATSNLLSFIPMQILKPDPPSSVNVSQVERRQTFVRVTWSPPSSWKSHDNYYKLMYEVKYRPRQSSSLYEQKVSSWTTRAEITDVMPGVQYQVQVRAKDEYDGKWSDWSEPVCASSWTDPTVYSTLPTPIMEEGSAFTTEGPMTPEPAVEKVSYHILWISGSLCLLLSVILVVYVFRHKDRFMPKLHHLSIISQRDDPSQPPARGPAAPEAQGLVTFAPRCYKEHQQRNAEEAEGENEEEQHVEDRMETVHFNNKSYFLL